MKVTTNLKSGNLLEDALQAASNFGNQASDFIYTAEQQAEVVSNSVTNTANDLWHGVTGFFGR